MSDWLTFTDKDRTLAEAFRMARLMHSIPTLIDCLVYPDLEDTLHIHTQDPKIFASLQLFSRDLQQQAYWLAGVREICLWNGGEDPAEQYSVESSSDVIIEHSHMTTATLDRPATYETSATADKTSTNVDKNLPGQTIAAIAEDTQQDINEIRDWCRENGWPIIPFGNDEIISGEAAIAALDWFGQILIQQRKAKRGLVGGTPATPEPEAAPAVNGKAPEPIAATPEPEAAPATKSTSRPLALANGFRNKATKGNARTNLLKALPTREDNKSKYLEEIVSGSDRGMAFLEKVASAITSRFGGDKEKMIDSLMSAAKKLQAETAKPAEA